MFTTDTIAISRAAVLTTKGSAVATAYRLLALLRDLDADERADCLELLEMEMQEGGLHD
jgi:hypothetical protein